MSLETANWISELSATDPPPGDQKSQGDDHLRLIKFAVKNTFPNASKAFYFPDIASVAGNSSVLASDMNRTIAVDTTAGAVELTLPTLAAGDAGWTCHFVKTNSGTNAYFIKPPTGTIRSGEVSGLARTRRCIPGRRTTVVWTGSAWIAERVVTVPIGTVIDTFGASTPIGWELANGSTLASASTNYPDYNAFIGSGVLPDLNGRVTIGLDTVGANRVTAALAGLDSATPNAVGGSQTLPLMARSDLPNGAINTSIPAGTGAHQHDFTIKYTSVAVQSGSGNFVIQTISTGGGSSTLFPNGVSSNTLPGIAGVTESLNGGVPQTARSSVPPAIVARKIVAVE